MRKIMLAAATAAAMSTPAIARDGQPYVGIEGGVLVAKDQNIDITLAGTDELCCNGTFENALGVDYKTGVDLDLIAGYDFGMFRLEAELGWKRAGLDELEVDDEFAAELDRGRRPQCGLRRCRPRRQRQGAVRHGQRPCRLRQ